MDGYKIYEQLGVTLGGSLHRAAGSNMKRTLSVFRYYHGVTHTINSTCLYFFHPRDEVAAVVSVSIDSPGVRNRYASCFAVPSG